MVQLVRKSKRDLTNDGKACKVRYTVQGPRRRQADHLEFVAPTIGKTKPRLRVIRASRNDRVG